MTNYYNEYPMFNGPDNYMNYDLNPYDNCVQDYMMPVDEYSDDYYDTNKDQMKDNPNLNRHIQQLIEEVCNQLDYEGSFIYDEYPSKDDIEKIVEKIYSMVENSKEMPRTTDITAPLDVEAKQYGRNIQLRDNIRSRFLDDMYNRRRKKFPKRYRYHRPRYYRRRHHRPRYRRPRYYYPRYYRHFYYQPYYVPYGYRYY